MPVPKTRTAATPTVSAVVVAALVGMDASQKELPPTPTSAVAAKRVPDNDKVDAVIL